MRYPLAPQGVFQTIQGEGAMLGVPMVFIRLAGCSVGCKQCDTDYSVSERVDETEIASRVMEYGARWIWITGGEPADHDLTPLVQALRKTGKFIAIATSGVRKLPQRWEDGGPDWYSVSPHSVDKWTMRYGQEVKLVPGLNGLRLADFDVVADGLNFGAFYVQPCEGVPSSVSECVDWVNRHPNWRMTVQAHKQWGLA